MKFMSLLTLHVAPENVAEVLDFYRRERVLEESGAASAQLMLDEENPGTVLITAFWSEVDGYARWLESPLRARLSAGIAAVAGESLTATNREYRVVHKA